MGAIEAYKSNAITTQSRGGLIVMLYDGAIKALRQAITALEAEDFAAKGQYIAKATDIIVELNSVLDLDEGGEIASDLRRLYNFMIEHLTKAHIQNDPEMFVEVISLLEDLNQGWKAIAD
ncbi:MAG: flagellar export chaperone FliS [Phycisphaerales bacterium]|jgi:flagellar secretion chaperone FliS|nr:flagellar export chaperone FliS [Phycisphaerales bacterium]